MMVQLYCFYSIQIHVTKARLEGEIVWLLLFNKNQHCNRYCICRESDKNDHSVIKVKFSRKPFSDLVFAMLGRCKHDRKVKITTRLDSVPVYH